MHIEQSRTYKLENIISQVFNAGLLKTGQQYSYYPGDDGQYQKGAPPQGDRFTDNGDGTVTDNLTGLMWIKDPAQAGLGSPMYWYDALNACENLIYAGHEDWRLPNINELLSIIDHSRYDPAFDPLFFIPFLDTWTPYWSSTSSASWIDGAWAMYPYDGYKTIWSKPWDMCYVRPVRGGQS